MAVGLLCILDAFGTEPLIVSLPIAASAAMIRPIIPTSTTSRNSNCPRREPMQYFGICFRASLSIHSAGWIFPFSTFITSCFSGHNTLLFLVVSGFCGLHDTIWPFKASPQPTFGTEQTPALRAEVSEQSATLDACSLSCFMSSPAPYPSFPPQRGENSLISLLLLFPLNPLGPGHLLLAYANSPCRWASVGTLTLSSVNSRTPAQIRPNSFGRCLFPQRLEKPHTAAPVAKHGLVFAVSPLPFDAL